MINVVSLADARKKKGKERASTRHVAWGDTDGSVRWSVEVRHKRLRVGPGRMTPAQARAIAKMYMAAAASAERLQRDRPRTVGVSLVPADD
jgi:hypothetical protein